jgi:hypothetical protein
MIIPHNSLDRDPSRESSQRIFIAVDEDGVASDVQTFGQQSAKGTYDLVSNPLQIPQVWIVAEQS